MSYLGKNSRIFFILGLLLCIPVIIPYFHSGYFSTHDGEWAVVRAGEMFREIRDLQFPPRYSGALNFGYGYPLFNFVYPFPYYLATLLHLFKFGFIDSVKIIFASSVPLSFIGMYFLSSYFWKNSISGFVSGILYVYLPYRLVDLYVRGSIGESMAFAIYPFLLLMCFFILNKKHVNLSIFVIAILTASLIMTHNISAVYFGIIAGAYLMSLVFLKKYKVAGVTLGAFIWGALLSSFFFVPALFEKSQIKLSKIPIADRSMYFVRPIQLIFSQWGYGAPNEPYPFTYQLGFPQVVGFIVALFGISNLKSERKVISGIFIILSVVFICIMFSPFFFVWKLPILSEINYPWTLLLPLGFLISFLSGMLTEFKRGKILCFLLILSAIFFYLRFAVPMDYFERQDSFYLTNPATTTSSNELMPLWVKKEPKNLSSEKIVPNVHSNLIFKSNKIEFHTSLENGIRITVNQIYYPGWTAYINGNKTEILYDNNKGLMQVDVPKGNNVVFLKFTETPLRLFTDIISVLSAVALFVFGAYVFWLKNHMGTGRS